MIEEKDPAEDRDEFIRRVNQVFDIFSENKMNNAIEELIKDNVLYKTNMKLEIIQLQETINGYIREWDAANTYEERQAVVAKVKR